MSDAAHGIDSEEEEETLEEMLEHLRAIRCAAERIERRVASLRRSAPSKGSGKVSDTDRAAARAAARKLGVMVRTKA